MIVTVNPATGQVLNEYHAHTPDEVREILDVLEEGWKKWRSLSFAERGRYLLALAAGLRDEKESCALQISLEMGKPIQLAKAEVEKCALACESFAKNAAGYLDETLVPTELKKSSIVYQPIGPILGIMPWNYPFWQVFRAAVPALMAGNVFLLKHAPICTGTALIIESLFKAILPISVFKSIILEEKAVSELILDSRIKGVTLTGSVRAGKSVALQAAQGFKKCVLELGGNDPYIVLADADVQKAADICVQARLANSGQICIAPKRLIIVQKVYEAFRASVMERLKDYTCGDPLDENTRLGPIARQDLRDQVIKQVDESIAKGAKLLTGGKAVQRPGFYYEPTVLENVKPGMPAFDEEIFGPVIALIKAQDEEEAVALANQSPYGLGAGVFTKDLQKGEYLAKYAIEAGVCYVNGIVSSDPRLPFGGTKASGLGRELGLAGIREFVNIKTIGIM